MFCLFCKRFHCIHIKPVLLAHWNYFGKFVEYWSPGVIFWGLFNPLCSQGRSKVIFPSILQKVSTGFTWNIFVKLIGTTFRGVENIIPGAQGAQDKRHNGTKFVWDISWRLLDRFSRFKSRMKSLWPQMRTGVVIFHTGLVGEYWADFRVYDL